MDCDVYILFFMDDEYGHWDILGVYSSFEELNLGWKRLSEFTDERCDERGSARYKYILLDYDKEKELLQDGQTLCGEQWFWKRVKLNKELYLRQL